MHKLKAALGCPPSEEFSKSAFAQEPHCVALYCWLQKHAARDVQAACGAVLLRGEGVYHETYAGGVLLLVEQQGFLFRTHSLCFVFDVPWQGRWWPWCIIVLCLPPKLPSETALVVL